MELPSIIDVLQSTIRMSTPLLLGGLGCLYTQRAGIWNIGVEGKMLMGCFFGVLFSVWTQSAWLGVFAAIVAGMIFGLLMALFIVTFKGDQIIVGVAVNILSLGLTTYLLLIVLGVRGSFGPEKVVPLDLIHFSSLKSMPIIEGMISGYSPLVYISWLLVIISAIILYRTRFGLNLRAVGEHVQSASTAGISVKGVQYIGFSLAGALSGLAGAQLTLGFLPIFSENMTTGRGFIAFSAVILGGADPLKIFFAALMFGFAEAVAMIMQSSNLPVHFPLMIPYVITIVVLVVSQGKK